MTWDEFANRVRDRFVPANWKMDALAHFYSISQNSLSFMDYATRLQEARNVLSSGGTGFTISNSVFKNHLLFFSHPILSLQMHSIPSFDYPKARVDGLMALMSSTWDSMVAECVLRAPLSTTSVFPPRAPRLLSPSLTVNVICSNKLVVASVADGHPLHWVGYDTALAIVRVTKLWASPLHPFVKSLLSLERTMMTLMTIL